MTLTPRFSKRSTESWGAIEAITVQPRLPSSSALPPPTTTPAAIPPKLSTQVFAEIPTMSGFRIAPNGLRLLVRNDVGGKTRLVVIDPDDGVVVRGHGSSCGQAGVRASWHCDGTSAFRNSHEAPAQFY